MKNFWVFTVKINWAPLNIQGFIENLRWWSNNRVQTLLNSQIQWVTWKYDTMLDYAQVISDFVKFSPESKIEDYVNYLKFKSGCPTLNNNKDFVVKGTVVKYANIIRRYLFSLYQIDIPKVKINYFRKPKQRKIDPIPKLTKEDVFHFIKL